MWSVLLCVKERRSVVREWGEYWCWCCVNVYIKVHLLFVVLMCVCVSE